MRVMSVLRRHCDTLIALVLKSASYLEITLNSILAAKMELVQIYNLSKILPK